MSGLIYICIQTCFTGVRGAGMQCTLGWVEFWLFSKLDLEPMVNVVSDHHKYIPKIFLICIDIFPERHCL